MSYRIEGNLLKALDRRKVPEDFLSAAFAHLIQKLVREHRHVMTDFLSWLLDSQVVEGDLHDLKIHIHKPLKRSRKSQSDNSIKFPDLTIETPRQVTYLEVKRTDRDKKRLRAQLREYVRRAKQLQNRKGRGVFTQLCQPPEPGYTSILNLPSK